MDGIALDDYIKSHKSKSKPMLKLRRSKSAKPGPRRTNDRPKKVDAEKLDTPKAWKKVLLMVEDLPLNFQNDQLNKLFSKHGSLTRCNILYDKLGASKVL